jgi:ComF family protein
MSYTSTFFNGLVHLLYPHVCAGCGSDLVGENQLICLDCIAQLPVTNFFMHAGNPVEKIFRGRLNIQTAAAYAYFTKQSVMQQLLHQLKYKGRKDVGLYLGNLMGETIKRSKRCADIDALVPLPLHFMKQKKRGYNQAQVICEGIAEATEIPVYDDVIIRRTKTDTQTRKNRLQRWRNIEGKFELARDMSIRNKHILLVDDVITTGATLEACGSELLKSENVRLSIASLAYTSL